MWYVIVFFLGVAGGVFIVKKWGAQVSEMTERVREWFSKLMGGTR